MAPTEWFAWFAPRRRFTYLRTYLRAYRSQLNTREVRKMDGWTTRPRSTVADWRVEGALAGSEVCHQRSVSSNFRSRLQRLRLADVERRLSGEKTAQARRLSSWTALPMLRRRFRRLGNSWLGRAFPLPHPARSCPAAKTANSIVWRSHVFAGRVRLHLAHAAHHHRRPPYTSL